MSTRHTGGQKGYEYPRGTCPVCDMSISGGREIEQPGYYVRLRRHKVTGSHPGRPWCAGTGQVVRMDAPSTGMAVR